MIKTTLKLLLLGGVAVFGAVFLGSTPIANAYDRLRNVFVFTPAACESAPSMCFDARERNLKAALSKLRDGRAQAEIGLRTIDAEEAKQRELLDANSAMQAILRTRAGEMIRSGATSLTFQGRAYVRADAEQQAQLLVREDAAFRQTLVEFASRRSRLSEARLAAVVEDNRICGALATLAAEKAIVVASGSLDGARQLLDDAQTAERRASEVTEAVVRSTREMTPVQPQSMPAAAQAGFDFQRWIIGQTGPLADAH